MEQTQTQQIPVHPLRKLRKTYGLKQGEFGALIGTSGERVAQIEGGHASLTERAIANISEAFNIEADQLRADYKDYQETRRRALQRRIRGEAEVENQL